MLLERHWSVEGVASLLQTRSFTEFLGISQVVTGSESEAPWHSTQLTSAESLRIVDPVECTIGHSYSICKACPVISPPKSLIIRKHDLTVGFPVRVEDSG